MFTDRARIFVKAGDGGNGMSSFRREKFVPKGGPSGGDGGRGGDVVLKVDDNLNTLVDFRYKRQFKALHGVHGQTKNMHGSNADTLYISVPPGTVVRDEETDRILADLTYNGQEAVVARAGRGGRGNARFANSVNRAPTIAERGEPGEQRWLRLELKLLADVGLIGYPSVGKSSILSQVSAAKPDIAAYHFTTLSPVLGVVSLREGQSFVLADIPGLIEGAHDGVGLGHDFLRHIERTKVLIHVLDVSGQEGRDPLDDYEKINNELVLYNEKLAKRTQIVAANKMDLPDAQENFSRVAEFMAQHGRMLFPVSAATGEGMEALMEQAFREVTAYVEPIEESSDEVVYELAVEEDFTISRSDDGAFVIQGKSIEKLVAMTNFNDDEGLRRFQNILRRKGIDEALREQGISAGDTVRIMEMDFEFKL